MAMSENSRKVIEYLRSINGTDVTAADVAEALGLQKRQVDGIFTSAIQRKQYGVRVDAEVETENGLHKPIKLLRLTKLGMEVDLDAAEAPAAK